MCLSLKSGSWDQMPSDLQQIFHSIVAKQPFRASSYFFNELVLNHNKESKKFLLYPRFLMRCIIAELGNDIVAGPKSDFKGLGSQIFARHNKQAIQADDVQGEPEPLPKEPTSSTPSKPQKAKQPKQQKSKKPSKPKKTTQGDEMPEDVNVHSALEKAPIETSSQLVATSQPANTAPNIF